jgi:hypothetical protein
MSSSRPRDKKFSSDKKKKKKSLKLDGHDPGQPEQKVRPHLQNNQSTTDRTGAVAQEGKRGARERERRRERERERETMNKLRAQAQF